MSGATQVQVVHRYGVHVQTVRSYLSDAGVEARPRRKSLSAENVDQAHGLLSQGAGLRLVARQFGMSHTTLAKRLREDSENEEIVGGDGQIPDEDVTPVTDIDMVQLIESLDRVAPLVHQLALAWAELAATNEVEGD